MKIFLYLIISFSFIAEAFAYKMVMIQGVSREGQTFITRTGKKNEIFVGMKANFTSDDVTIICKAINVTHDFTQWEIENDYTDVPFQRGQVVTMRKAQEYLWALSPSDISKKYIKAVVHKQGRALEGYMTLTRGLSESVSGTTGEETSKRSGYHFEGFFQKDINSAVGYALGLRYTRETISIPASSIINQQFLGMFELRYFFPEMEEFYDSYFFFALGFGYGQSRSEHPGAVSSGQSLVLPTTSVSLGVPINHNSDFTIRAAIESIRIEEKFEASKSQNSNISNFQIGAGIKRKF